MRAIAFAVAALVSIPSAEAEDPKPAQAESAWQKLFREHATGYRILLEGEKEPAKVSQNPVLFWTQPVRGGNDGAVYLWTHQGRPVAIGAIFIWPAGNNRQGITHEFHALTNEPFVAQWKNRRWKPKPGGLLQQTLTGVDPPGPSPQRRLLQMKKLASQFTATSTDKDDRDWELRLLPQPIYRYEVDDETAMKSTVIDGTLFGFVQGTDLEVVLALEAHRTEKDSLWRYALARMSDLRLKVTHSGKPVWTVDRAKFDDAQSAYYCGAVEFRSEPPK
jgi:hypothetical protein